MKLVLGIDEAGYGPNLGPLVIACTAWLCRTELAIDQWAELLQPEFSNKARSGPDAPIALGDSKVLYSSATRKLSTLDRTIGFFLSRLSRENPLMMNRADLVDSLDEEFVEQLTEAPWLAGEVLPQEQMVAPEQIEATTREQSILKMESIGIRFLDVRLRVISEPRFNSLLEVHGNKASLLTFESLRLAKSMMSRLFERESATLMSTPMDAIEMYFDKHGGRSKYASALSNTWPDWFVVVDREGQQQSSYHIYPTQIPKDFHFVAKGD
jgi:hypothetical protein